MRRLIGSLLVLHGVAHAAAGIWATPAGPTWLLTLLWWVAMVGFAAAGAGLIGVPRLDKHWLVIAAAASVASLLLIARYPQPATIFGSTIDGAVLIGTIPMAREIVLRQIGVPLHPPHRRATRLATSVMVIGLAYMSGVVLLRPWQLRWAVSGAKLATQLPGKISFGTVALAPLGLFVFEPAHFVMERGMLRGIKQQRAEGELRP